MTTVVPGTRLPSPDKVANQRIRRLSANSDTWRLLNFSQVDYDRLFEAQDGTCALCRRYRPGKMGAKRPRLDVDHDHNTMRVRGLLCRGCNTKLGWLERIGLMRIIAYLGVSG